MKHLAFSTGNATKFLTAKHVCDRYDIRLTQETRDIVEIQDEPENVALDKAAKAYKLLKRPVVISDDSWSFSGLNGFPGVYMHAMNEWFTTEDFLRLTLPLEDRKVTLTQYLVYTDAQQQKVFAKRTAGTLLKEIRGKSEYPRCFQIITLAGDSGQSIAEVYDKAPDQTERQPAKVWFEFAAWFSNN